MFEVRAETGCRERPTAPAHFRVLYSHILRCLPPLTGKSPKYEPTCFSGPLKGHTLQLLIERHKKECLTRYSNY